jgi:hypothetical protein
MSLSMEPEMQDFLEKQAQKRGVSRSKLIRDLVEKYLVSDDDVIPVILKVPSNLKGDADGLQKWMELKSSAIVKALAGC